VLPLVELLGVDVLLDSVPPLVLPVEPVPVEPMELVPPDDSLLPLLSLLPVDVPLGGLAPEEELVPVPPVEPAVPPPPCLLHAASERAATTARTAGAVLVRVVFIRKLL